MCREETAKALRTPPDFVYRPADGHPKGSSALRAAYISAVPSLAFCSRLESDPVVREWVTELHGLTPVFRADRAEELAKGALRGIGRLVVYELLLRGAARGSTRPILSAASFGAYFAARPGVDEPRRYRMGRRRETADRAVRRITSYPAGIEPEANTKAAQRAEQRLLQEVAARIKLDGGAVASPSRIRRSA